MAKILYQTSSGKTKKAKNYSVLRARHKKGKVAMYNKKEGGRCLNGMSAGRKVNGMSSTICRARKAAAGPRMRLDGKPDRRFKANKNTHIRFS